MITTNQTNTLPDLCVKTGCGARALAGCRYCGEHHPMFAAIIVIGDRNPTSMKPVQVMRPHKWGGHVRFKGVVIL